jgi:hypothetical protein
MPDQRQRRHQRAILRHVREQHRMVLVGAQPRLEVPPPYCRACDPTRRNAWKRSRYRRWCPRPRMKGAVLWNRPRSRTHNNGG